MMVVNSPKSKKMTPEDNLIASVWADFLAGSKIDDEGQDQEDLNQHSDQKISSNNYTNLIWAGKTIWSAGRRQKSVRGKPGASTALARQAALWVDEHAGADDPKDFLTKFDEKLASKIRKVRRQKGQKKQESQKIAGMVHIGRIGHIGQIGALGSAADDPIDLPAMQQALDKPVTPLADSGSWWSTLYQTITEAPSNAVSTAKKGLATITQTAVDEVDAIKQKAEEAEIAAKKAANRLFAGMIILSGVGAYGIYKMTTKSKRR